MIRMLAAVPLLALSGCASVYTPVLDPLRTDDNFGRIRPGMTEEQVTQIAGKPDETMYFPLSGNNAWEYRYYDMWGYMADFSVTFGPDHIVQSRYSRRITDGGGHSGK